MTNEHGDLDLGPETHPQARACIESAADLLAQALDDPTISHETYKAIFCIKSTVEDLIWRIH